MHDDVRAERRESNLETCAKAETAFSSVRPSKEFKSCMQIKIRNLAPHALACELHVIPQGVCG